MIKARINSIFKRIAGLFFVLLVVFSALFGNISATLAFAATDKSLSFDTSSVVEDLGDSIDWAKYPVKEGAESEFYSLTEVCYSPDVFTQNYALYVYVYNPSLRTYTTLHGANTINMAVEFQTENGAYVLDEKGYPIATKYANVPLIYCGASDGEYANRMLKYRIDGAYSRFYNVVKSMEGDDLDRYYYIAGVQLWANGEENPIDYKAKRRIAYSGYAKGYGEGAEFNSTLKATWDVLETISLNLNSTYWRSNAYEKDHYHTVNTVYFSVPERYFAKYGYLQKIHADWWEYKTKMAAVTSNYDFYQTMLQHVGKDVGEYDSSVPFYLYSGYEGKGGAGYVNHYFDWLYNVERITSPTLSQSYNYDNMSTILPYAFFSPSVSVDSVFDFLLKPSETIAGPVDDTIVADWIYNYRNDLGHGYIDCEGKDISVDLFENFVDEGRTKGYNDVTIDLEDTFDLESYDKTHTWWEKFLDYGFWAPETGGDYEDVAPIYEVKDSDFVGTYSTIADNLLVKDDDVVELATYYAAEKAKGNRVILFRFAVTDFYSAASHVPHVAAVSDTDTYVAQQTVFLKFDIIDLTFNKAGVLTVIPAVANPIDVIPGLDPPPAKNGCRYIRWNNLLTSIIIFAIVIFVIYIVTVIREKRMMNEIYKDAKADNKEREQRRKK